MASLAAGVQSRRDRHVGDDALSCENVAHAMNDRPQRHDRGDADRDTDKKKSRRRRGSRFTHCHLQDEFHTGSTFMLDDAAVAQDQPRIGDGGQLGIMRDQNDGPASAMDPRSSRNDGRWPCRDSLSAVGQHNRRALARARAARPSAVRRRKVVKEMVRATVSSTSRSNVCAAPHAADRRSPSALPRSRMRSAMESGERTGTRSRSSPRRRARLRRAGDVNAINQTAPEVGASGRREMKRECRFAAARGSDNRKELTIRNERQGMENRERLVATLNSLRDLTQLNHGLGMPVACSTAALPSTTGWRTFHTVSATMRSPSAVGWMPSR